jgi:hypothetical protein
MWSLVSPIPPAANDYVADIGKTFHKQKSNHIVTCRKLVSHNWHHFVYCNSQNLCEFLNKIQNDEILITRGGGKLIIKNPTKLAAH